MIRKKQMILANLMMEVNSKKVFIFFALTILVGGLTVSVALAQNNSAKRANKIEDIKQKAKETTFCEKISILENKIGQKTSLNKSQIETKKQERLQKWQTYLDQMDAKMMEIRTRKEANLKVHFDMLEEKAETEEQKNAVAEFEKSLQTALATRNTSIDATLSQFRVEVKKLQTERKTELEKEVSAFLSSQKEAFSKAKLDCASGVDSETVKNDLKKSLTSEKEEFQVVKSNAEKNRMQMQMLIQTRNQAMQEAKDAFRISVETSAKDLKVVFPEVTNTEDSTDTAEETDNEEE